MNHLTSSDWWWTVAFDGIASSLLTAAFALVGIWLALRHDRRLMREAQLYDALRDLRERAVALQRKLREPPGAETLVWDPEFGDYLEELSSVVMRAHSAHQWGLGGALDEARLRLQRATDQNSQKGKSLALMALNLRLEWFMRDVDEASRIFQRRRSGSRDGG